MSPGPFDVVILSSVDWDAARQRHHAFAAGWAAAGHRVFFVENTGAREPGWRDLGRVRARLARALWPGGRAPGAAAAPPAGVSVTSPLLLPPTREAFRRLNAALLAPRLLARLRARGLGEGAVAFAYLPTATTLTLLDLLRPSLTVYDCVDNFAGLPCPPPDLAARQEELLARAGLVLASSPTLVAGLRGRRPDAVELHHGAAEAFFLPPRPPGPLRRLAYFGTIWRALDYAPVAALAEAGLEVDLIGPVKEPPPPLPRGARLRAAVAHGELPALLSGYDALLLPYADDEYNRGVLPAKTYECLATGRPVLASPLPAVLARPELSAALRVCRAPEDWVAAARRPDSPAERDARRTLARAHGEAACFERLRGLVLAARKAAA